jgi:ABC-type branched-subunit amino acid transport system substrate-binding protein
MHKQTISVILMSLAALGAGACGRDSETPATSSGSTGKDAPVKLFGIASVGSPIQNYPDIPAGAEAAVKALNAAGGINGHPVEFEMCNTQSDANRAVACARKAAQDKALAVVGQLDLFTAQTLPLLASANVPSVGINTPGNQTDVQHEIAFPLHAGAFANYKALPFGFAQRGVKRVAVLAADVPSALFDADLVEESTEQAGLKFAGTIKIPTTGVTDYAPFAQQLKKLNADGVALITTPAQTQAMMKTNASIGLDVQYGHNGFSFGESEAATLGDTAEGILLASPFPDARETEVPAVKAFVDEMTAAGKTKPIELRPAGFNAWLSVHAVATIAKDLGEDVTGETLKAALGKATGVDLKGLIQWSPGTTGPKGYEKVSNWKAYFVTIKDGQLTGADIDPVDVTPKS